jgi:hypothetical protein
MKSRHNSSFSRPNPIVARLINLRPIFVSKVYFLFLFSLQNKNLIKSIVIVIVCVARPGWKEMKSSPPKFFFIFLIDVYY